MRVPITRYQRVDGAPRAEAAGTAPVVEEVDIPRTPFLTAGALGGLIPALISLLTFWLMSVPSTRQTRDLEMNRYRIEVLQQALRAESPEDRKTSLALLRAAGVLRESAGSPFDSLLASTDTLPRWCSNSCSLSGSTLGSTAGPEPDTADKRSP